MIDSMQIQIKMMVNLLSERLRSKMFLKTSNLLHNSIATYILELAHLIYLFSYLFIYSFLRPPLQHMEVSRLGVESEP